MSLATDLADRARAPNLSLSDLSLPGKIYRGEISPTNWKFTNRLDLSASELALASFLLDLARYQQHTAAAPLLSNFKVGAGGYCGQGRIVVGANHERGGGPAAAVDDSIHGEDAIVAAALSCFGKEARLQMVAVTTDASAPSSSCGRCRGALETFADGDLIEISAGNNNEVSMWRLSELLPKNFRPFIESEFNAASVAEIRNLVAEAMLSAARSFQPFTSAVLGPSGAAILADGRVYSGSRVDSVAFYGTNALASAIAATINARPERVTSIALTSRHGVITPQERQFLYEFANTFGIHQSLPVYLHSSESDSIRVATPSEILPYAFGPRDLGIKLETFL